MLNIEKHSALYEKGEYTTGDALHDSFLKLNVARTRRIDKTYTPGAAITEAVQGITEKQFWMVLSEDWCGDSAQNIPMLAKMAALNPLIEFRILYRDENPAVMDLYLTNGTRSIPKLVVYDADWNELFTWGARPAEGQQIVLDGKAAGLSKEKFLEQLHIWYSRNRGTALEAEMLELISGLKK